MNAKGINILFNNGDNIVLDNNECKDFYITNLDKQGNEVSYDKTIIRNKLYANFCLIKLVKLNNFNKIDRIKMFKDIIEVDIITNDNKLIKFDIASDADPFADIYNNSLEYVYEDDNCLGLILSKYDIKYKENLFV